jgi:UDP-N-acetylglucosamine--N-acetylmuramyl-(pentapeptide) pyrophosphoryl-undecaprenol N-acetylglucosamine transferase
MDKTRDSSRSFRLLLTGGGTGGHLFPAVAAAEAMRERYPDSAILFVGTKRLLDRQSLTQAGFQVKTILSFGLKGKRLLELIKACLVLPVALVQAVIVLVRFRPDVVLGVGGYVTGPVVATAWLLRIPTVIHEQNSIPGLANRLLGRLARRVCLSIPVSNRFFAEEKTVLTGNPVRREVCELAGHLKETNDAFTVLVLGGSQGAHGVNELMVSLFSASSGLPAGIRIIHQTGARDADWVAQRYHAAGVNAEVAAFFHDMATIYTKGDVAVSRAGATTLAELAVVGMPALLIPYPHAADDHQRENGNWYVAGGGALMFAQDQAGAARIGAEITDLAHNPERRQAMAKAMAARGTTEAATRLVDVCLEAADGR